MPAGGALTDRGCSPAEGRASTLVDLLQASRDRYPQKIALVCGDDTRTYRDLDTASTCMAANLIARGLREGDRVAVHLLNGSALVMAYYACFKAGAIVVPVNTRMKCGEVEYVLRHSGASVYIGQHELYAEAAPIRARMPNSTWYLADGADDDGSAGSVAQLLTTAPPDIRLPAITPDQVVAILYTSGTTAKPKGVMHTHRTLGWWLSNAVPRDPHAVIVLALPIVHIAGFMTLVTGVTMGATAVLIPRFDPDLVLDAIERHRGNMMSGTPAMYHALVDAQRSAPRDVRSMRTYGASGDSVPRFLQGQFARTFGRPLRDSYASTELVPITVNVTGATRSGSLGHPAAGVAVRLVDDRGTDVGLGDVGEVVVRTPGMTVGYWNDPEATAAAFCDGWFYTGDLAHRDADGYLWFNGRKKEIIVRGGSNVSPQEVEEVLCQHPAVSEAGVVGLPDRVSGEIVAACVTLRPGSHVTPDELIAFARQRIAQYKSPERVFVLPELPKSVSGKLQRRALRDVVFRSDHCTT